MATRRWRTLTAAGAWLVAAPGCLVAPTRPVPTPARVESPGALPRPIPPNSSDNPEAILATLIAAHNKVRAEAGRPPLEADPRLMAAAEGHARDMAAHRRMSHRGSGGTSPFRRIEAQGYRFRAAGENVAAGQPTPEAVMRAWLRSPGHRRNILGAFSQIGAGHATDAGGTSYWCVTFGDLAGP